MRAAFIGSTNTAFRIIARATTASDGTTLQMRAFRVSSADPGGWPLSHLDAGADQLTEGRAGVRLSFYPGPARMTVDDVQIAFG